MLEIKNLSVESADSGKKILENVNLKLSRGKVYALTGKNGSGKSTLANVVMGKPGYRITSGDIVFMGKSVLGLSPDKRARKGIFLSFQCPPGVEGVTLFNLARNAHNSLKGKKLPFSAFQRILEDNSKGLGLGSGFFDRHVNESLSGGEKKKSEILQALVMRPRFIILDELDSGLDPDSMRAVSRQVKKLAGKSSTILMITHYRGMIDYLKPDAVFVMDKGRIIPKRGKWIADKIDKNGGN
jgi:Fe-S cluster assembly ATP-binding protein